MEQTADSEENVTASERDVMDIDDLSDGEGPSKSERMDEGEDDIIDKENKSNQDEEKKLPKTTIRRIDKRKDLLKDKTSIEVCETIIEKYNKENQSSYQQLKSLNELSMTILVYMEKKEKISKLAKVFTTDSEERCVVVSYIVFIITNKDNIYCLTYEDARHVIHGFEDTSFARGVAKSVTNKKIKQFGMRHLRGINYAVSNFFRAPTSPERLQVNGVVTNIQSRVSDVSLEKADYLKLNTKVGAIVNVSRNGVRFMKDLTLHTICKQIEWLDDEKVGKEGDGSDIMDYIMEVEDKELQEKLENKMFDTILNYMKKNESVTEEAGDGFPPFDFMYKDFEKHVNGKQFSFHLPTERKISGDIVLESFDDAVNSLRVFLKDALINKVTLTFKYDGESSKENKLFLHCLSGTVKHEEADYAIDAGKWTKGDENVEEKSLHKTLNEILVDHILEDMAPVTNGPGNEQFRLDTKESSMLKQCSFSIKAKKPVKAKKSVSNKASAKANQSAIDKKLVDLSSYSDALCELKRYLRKKLSVSFLVDEPPPSTDLMLNYFQGEIRLDDEAQTDGSKIFQKVDGKWFRYNQQFYNCLQDSFKSLLRQKLVTTEDTEVNLPKIWPPGMGEEKYNQLYTKERGFYVGDTITPNDIELFDIMKVTDNELYLYHVKEKFDNIVRVACSQIRNSASVINSSRYGGGEENYLEKFYEKFCKKEQRKLEDKDTEEFLKLFQEKRIVFVYAFTKTCSKRKHPNPAIANGSLHDGERTDIFLKDCLNKYGLDGYFKSMIARHELYYTNTVLEDLGFGFSICQIPKYIVVKEEETS